MTRSHAIARSGVRRNITANFAAGALGSLFPLVFLPLYLRCLGAEGYGVVALFTVLAGLASGLDLGLGLTLNRELARVTSGAEPAADGASVVATLEATCWLVGMGVGMVFLAAVPLLGPRWVTPVALSAAEVTRAMAVMGLALPVVIVRAFYVAGLNGLQRQMLTATVQTIFTASRDTATVIALVFIAPRPTVFLAVHLAAFVGETAVLAVALRRSLPPVARGGGIRPAVLRGRLRFAAGLAGTTLLGAALTFMDQLVVSATAPLVEFGYYAVACSLAAMLGQLVQPVTTAVYPRFSQLVAIGAAPRVVTDYHFFSQVVAVLVLPVAAVLAVFADQTLLAWTGSATVAAAAAGMLAVRVTGTSLNTLMHVPHVVQLAHGWSSLGAATNVVALVVLLPATVGLSRGWGAIGAAWAWLALNVGYLVVPMSRMHRRILIGQLTRWYGGVLGPAAAVAVVALGARLLMPAGLGAAGRIAWLSAVWAAGVLTVAATAPELRARVMGTAPQRVRRAARAWTR